MYWYMLDDARGVLEDGVLTVSCGDDLTYETLSGPDASAVIREVAVQRLGEGIDVRFVLGGETPSGEDRLEDLIRRGSKFDSFVVK